MTTIAATEADDPRRDQPTDGGTHDLKRLLEEHERDLILAALRASRGNKAQAARSLGITERLMGIRVKRLGIDWRSLRPRYARRQPAV